MYVLESAALDGATAEAPHADNIASATMALAHLTKPVVFNLRFSLPSPKSSTGERLATFAAAVSYPSGVSVYESERPALAQGPRSGRSEHH
jgi:hypothetical protein